MPCALMNLFSIFSTSNVLTYKECLTGRINSSGSNLASFFSLGLDSISEESSITRVLCMYYEKTEYLLIHANSVCSVLFK